MNRHQAARLVLLLVAVGAGGVAVLALAGPWLPATLTGPLLVRREASATGPDGFAGLVSATCALALVACWAWLALGTVVVAVESLGPAPAPSGWWLRWVPGAIRVLVPVLLGAAVTAAPASASPEAGPSHAAGSAPLTALTGLPLPDRVPTRVADHHRTVLVRPGDSLWRITTRLLPSSAPVSAVDRGWRRIARANAARVRDPDLIVPGTRLRVPPLTVHPREEAS